MESVKNEGESIEQSIGYSILNKKELSELSDLFRKENYKSAKEYLNKPERKSRLESKGITPDYLYFQFEKFYLLVDKKLTPNREK